jgi:hypothetical protein
MICKNIFDEGSMKRFHRTEHELTVGVDVVQTAENRVPNSYFVFEIQSRDLEMTLLSAAEVRFDCN